MYNCRNKQDMLITDLYRNTDVMPSIRVWSMFPMFPSSTSTLINIVRLVLYMFLREDECVIIWITRRVMMIVCAHLNMLRRERVGRGFGVWWLCHQQLIPSSVYARTYALIFRLSRFNHRQRPSSPNLMFLGCSICIYLCLYENKVNFTQNTNARTHTCRGCDTVVVRSDQRGSAHSSKCLE